MIGFALFPLIVRHDHGEEAGAVVLIYGLRWSWQKRLMRGAKRWSGKCAVQFIQMGAEPPVRVGVFLDEPADGTGWPLEAAGLTMLFRQPLDLYPGIAADLLQETQYQPLIALRRRR